MARSVIVLHSSLSPDVAAKALRRELVDERPETGLPVDFRSAYAVRGMVAGQRFEVSRRGYRNNSLAARFYGSLEPETGGTRVVGRFGFPRWVRWMMWAWLGAAAVFGIPIFLLAVAEAMNGTRLLSGNLWVALVVPPGLLLYAALLPVIGRYLRRGDERYIVSFLEDVIAAGPR